MAKIKVDNKLNVVIGTKAQVEADNTIPDNSIVIVTDEELTPSDIPQLAPSKITQDANNRFVTDTEKSTWNGKQDKLVAGDNISIIDNTISASGGGDVDLNEMAYYNYAGSIYGAKYSLLANAWQDMKDSESVLFDIPLALAAPNQDMGGVTVDLYVGTDGQLQALYDACVNETISQNDTYYVNNAATRYYGDVSGDVGFPIPLYQFGTFGVSYDNTAFLVGDITSLSMGLGLVLAKIVNVSIPNNNIVIQQGFEFENENGIIIPNSVTSIQEDAFRNWTLNNQPLVIPNSVTSIGRSSFFNWSSNNQPLVIPNSVTYIDFDAFFSWSSNNHPVIIPNSVTLIDENAFGNWTSAKEFIMESETPPNISIFSFNNTNNAPFYVPNDSVEAYKTQYDWAYYADRIFPISDKGNGGDACWEPLRTRGATSDLTSVNSGDSVGSVSLTKTLTTGNVLAIEVNTQSSYTFKPKIIIVTLNTLSSSPNTTSNSDLYDFSSFNGTNIQHNSFAISGSGSNLYFGSKKYIQGAFSGSNIEWITGTYTLYVGRVWRLKD